MQKSNTCRVMYLIDYYDGPYAGTQVQLLNLISDLDRDVIQPHITLFHSTSYIEKYKLPCPVEILNIKKLLSISTIFKLMKFAYSLKKRNFKLIHIYFNDASLIAPLFLKFSGFKVVISRRDMGIWYNKYNLPIMRINSKLIDCAIVNSKAVKNIVHEKEWIDNKKLKVIYNGYDIKKSHEYNNDDTFFKKYGLSKACKIIGIVANLRPIKRIDDLIRAFEIVSKKHDDVVLTIIGEDLSKSNGNQLTKKYLNLAESLCISERVIFTGKIEDVENVIKHFSVGVLCSESEGFSNSIIEYMICAKPTVCTNVGGNVEIIENGINGYLVNVGDISAIANKINMLLENETLAKMLGENGRKKIIKNYSMQKMIAEHTQLYQSLTNC